MTTTAADRDDLVGPDVARALLLSSIVRDGTVDEVQAVLAPLSSTEVLDVVVALARAVDVELTVRQLYAWRPEAQHPGDSWSEHELRRAHAAYVRGERPTWVLFGERGYQRNRRRRQRARTAPLAAS